MPARQLPQDILTVNYNGVLSSSFFVEGLYSRRKFTFENSGSPYTDLIKGTLIRDQSTRQRPVQLADVLRRLRPGVPRQPRLSSSRAPTSCPPESSARTTSCSATTTSPGSGSEQLPVRQQLPHLHDLDDPPERDIFPVIDSHSYVYFTPITNLEQGHGPLTHSVFVNDSWRLSDRLSVNLGVRWDKNHAEDSNGVVRANDSAFSPRLAVAWDVTGKGTLRVGASYAKYVGAIQDNLMDSRRTEGSPGTSSGTTTGRGATPINTNPLGAPLDARPGPPAGLQLVLLEGLPEPHDVQAPARLLVRSGAHVAIQAASVSLDERIRRDVSGNIDPGFAYRVDLVRREGRDFYNNVINGSTGTAVDEFGNAFDIGYYRQHEQRRAQLHGSPHEPRLPGRRFQRRDQLDVVAHARQPQRRDRGLGSGPEHVADVSGVQGRPGTTPTAPSPRTRGTA